ncbi:MAG: efflux RND transporter permease subunit [bacterium]
MEESKQSRIGDIKRQVGDFFRFTTERPVAILMVAIGVAVFGWISYEQLPLNLMPDITYPSLTVRTEYPGTAPEEVETQVSRPVEQALGVVDNLVGISSISKAGQSDVKLEYSWDTDMNSAAAEVREKLDQVFLPDDAKRPMILRYDPSLDPIMRLGLYGEASLVYLRYLADEDLKRKLETIDGVAAVKVKGGLEEEIRVELHEQKLTLIGINIQQVRNRLAQENVNLAGGNLKEGQTEYIVRTLNEFRDVDEIAEVVIGTWNSTEIKIKDVADVRRTFKERKIITRIGGHESVEIEVYKEADANIVAVAKRVEQRVFGTADQQAFVRRLEAKESESEEEKKEAKADEGGDQGGPGQEFLLRQMTDYIAYQLPSGINIETLSDQSIFIENSVNEVKRTAVIGGMLAVLVLFVFLRNLTVTLIVGISIPVSIIATFAPMKIFDVSLNIMSLGGLALGIGMLVDNSIVVLESIARCREEGDNLIQATIRGVSEVGSAVFASTLTTVAVFFPIVFVEGVAGQVFGDMALTVVFSLLASLAVALFLIPMLSSRESGRFVSGVQLGELMKQHILSFSTEPEITGLIQGEAEGSAIKKLLTGLLVLLKTNGQIILKILRTFAAVLLAFVKFLVMPIILLVMPLFAILRLVGVIKFKFSERAIRVAQNPDFWRVRFVKEIWPTYLVNTSMPAFYQDLGSIFRRIKESRWKGKIGRVLLLPLSLFFYSVKYFSQILLEFTFRLFHFFVMTLAIFFKGIFIQLKLVFAIPAMLIFTAFNWSYGKIEAVYPKVLRYSLSNRYATLSSVALLAILVAWVIVPRVGSELIPEVHQGEFNIEITMPVGTPVERTVERSIPVEEFLINEKGVEKVAMVAGTDKTANASSEEGEHTAKLTVRMRRASSVIVQEEELIKRVRSQMANYSGMQWKISRPVIFSFKTPVEIEIHGYNLQKLQEISQRLEEDLKAIPGLFDIKSNVQRGNPEVQIIYNRPLLARYGLNISEVASIVRNKVRGDVATEFKDRDRKIDILVRLREEDKKSIENLGRLIVNPDGEKPIRLEAVAAIRVNEGPAEIRRVDQERTAVITANISGRDLRSVGEDIYALLRNTQMPDDFNYDLAGQNKEMETSLNSLMLALALAIFLVYIVMASQFESLVHPFVIIFTIPLGLIGVFLVLFVLQIPLSIVVFLGMIMLAGIVVNNAIVLVDYINRLRHKGMEKMEAIIQAGRVRLRPIMMTTATTVLGLLPMAIGFGDGAEIRTPMAITVIVGLLSSTVLTLVVIPTVYSLVDRRD